MKLQLRKFITQPMGLVNLVGSFIGGGVGVYCITSIFDQWITSYYGANTGLTNTILILSIKLLIVVMINILFFSFAYLVIIKLFKYKGINQSNEKV
jgi:hypothetical protein